MVNMILLWDILQDLWFLFTFFCYAIFRKLYIKETFVLEWKTFAIL